MAAATRFPNYRKTSLRIQFVGFENKSGCYGVWCGLMHIPSHIIPLKEDFTLDPKDYYGLNQTIVLANPNAPTGIALPRAEIEGILKANPNNVVIVDEAYVDFGGESCVPLIDQYENLLSDFSGGFSWSGNLSDR